MIRLLPEAVTAANRRGQRAGFARLLWVLVLLVPVGKLTADELPPAFFGEFEGRSVTMVPGDKEERDLGVKIERTRSGFTVDWRTRRYRADGSSKLKAYSIEFVPSKRAGIYSSAMKTNVFGGRVAHDPLRGDPYFWARVRDSTLTVYAMLIADDGGFDLQVYERRLRDDGGLDLRYTRHRESEPVRVIDGVLYPKKD